MKIPFIQLRWTLLSVAVLFPAANALGWNAAGHRITATIAWQEMSPGTQQKVTALLARHPGHPNWLRALNRGRNTSPVTAAGIFAESSTWADDIRRDERFSELTEDDDSPWARHRDWHYVNWPVDRNRAEIIAGSRTGQLDRQLQRLSARLSDPARPDSELAADLVWLVHLVGDAHQPLHVASFPGTDGSHDPGGLDFPVHDPMRLRFSEVSLHVWWDDLPGPPWLRGESLNKQCAVLRERHPARSIDQKSALAWLDESLMLARHSVRPATPPEAGIPWEVSDAYRRQSIAIADRRLAEAGVRLGRLLDTLLARRTTPRFDQESAGAAGASATNR